MGYACSMIEGAIISATRRRRSFLGWPGRNVGLALKAGFTGLVCFLAGPVLLVVASGVYWINCGDPSPLDWTILGELNLLAIAYAVAALLSVNRRGRLRDVNPLTVARFIYQLPGRVLFTLLVSAAILLAHEVAAVLALDQLLRHLPAGWLTLFLCSLSALFFSILLFRLLGMWCYQSPADVSNTSGTV
jgi:hypothetical protein